MQRRPHDTERVAQPIIPPDLREKPRRPVNSNVEAVEKPFFGRILGTEMARIFAPFCFCLLIDLF
jgi:hypothetical protein